MPYHSRRTTRRRNITQQMNSEREEQQQRTDTQTPVPTNSGASAASLPVFETYVAPPSPRTTRSTSRRRTPIQQRAKNKSNFFKKNFPQPTRQEPIESNLISVTKTLYDGANVRKFYGIEDIPVFDFVTTILKEVPVVRIDELNSAGGVINTYAVNNRLSDGKRGGGKNKKKRKKYKKFSIVRGDIKNSNITKGQTLTEITSENRYNISVDGELGQAYPITFMGLENPSETTTRYYDEPPIEPIPASLPDAYQNSANDGVELLKDGRRCSNCIFYDPEVSNCSKWNANVRLNYWCASWQTLEPIIAESNQFTTYIEESTVHVSEGDLYDYFLNNVKDPTTEEPNLSNFLSPLNTLFANFGAYVYGDYLRRVIDSGDAFDYDGIPINLFFTTQEGFLNAIDFINNAGLLQFNDPEEEYDSIQQALCTYTLIKKSASTLPSNYPQSITINLHGKFYGEPKNILSQLDLTNAKIAYNPQYSANNHHILKDNRFDIFEPNGILHMDIVKLSVRERVLKFLVDNSREYRLDGSSSYSFIQWVADRSAFTESMQALYQLLLTVESISSENQELLDAIELSLGQQLLDDPSTTEVPLTTYLIDAEVEE